MLEKILLHNFKSHQSTQLNFDSSRLHALVGQNSTGKTSVLEALYYLSQLINSRLTEIFQHERSPQFVTTIGQKNMSVTVNGFWGETNRRDWEVSYGWEQKDTDSWQIYSL